MGCVGSDFRFRLASDPAPLGRKEGRYCMHLHSFGNESLRLVILSVNFLSISDIYSLVPTSEDSDKTVSTPWIIPQPLKEKQRFSVQAVIMINATWEVYGSFL